MARSSTDLLPKKTIVDRFKRYATNKPNPLCERNCSSLLFFVLIIFFRYLNAYSRTEDDGLNPSSHMDSTNHSAGPLQDDQMEEDLPAAGAVLNIF